MKFHSQDSGATMDSKQQQEYQEAQELYRQERWAEALVIFDDLSLSYKSDKDIMMSRAMCLSRVGKEEEAELICDYLTVVHKDPRAAQIKAQIPQAKRDGKTAPKEKKAQTPLLDPLVVKRVVVAVFVAALAYAGWTFFSTYKAPVPPSIATAPAPSGRTLKFPADVSLGSILIRDWGYSTNLQGKQENKWQSLGEARGKVDIPDGKEVQLRVSPVQAANLAAIRRLGSQALQSLNLNDCPVGDVEMGYIAHLTGLFQLSIDGTRVSPAGYEKLYRLTSLREISMTGTRLGVPGRIFIGNQPYLADIDADIADLDDDWLIGLPPMEHLVFLSLDDIEGITDAGIAEIAKHRNLKNLYLSYTGITDVGVKNLQTLKRLERLWLEGTKVTDASMAGFRTMPNIAEIGIAYTTVTNEGLMELSGIRTLKKVGIRGCENITLAGARRFKNLNPDCFVDTAFEL